MKERSSMTCFSGIYRRSARRNTLRHLLLADRSGTTAVEFAFLAPVLFVIFLGIVEFGRLLWTQSTLQQAVQAAARCASVNPTLCNTDSATETYAATQAFGLPVSSSAFTATTATCGNQVSANLPFNFVVPALFPENVTLTAFSCYPSQSQK
jgi:Flp pilus assembly protein TadG